MDSQPSESRELTPVQMFWGDGGPKFKDFSVGPVPSDTKEAEEVEEAITPAPKDSSVPESVISSESPPINAPPESTTPALPLSVSPTEALEDAVKESGKDSDESEDEPQLPTTTQPAQDDSSPSSSSPTNPGKITPPAVVKPPTGA